MVPPLRISGDDEKVIDLHDEEVVIDLKADAGAQGADGSAPMAAAGDGKAAAPPAGSGGPAPAGASRSPGGAQATAAAGARPTAASPARPPAAGAAAAPAPPVAAAGAGRGPVEAANGGGDRKVGIREFARTRNGRSVIVGLVAVMVVSAILFGSFANRPPTAVITVSLTEVTDGNVIELSGSGSSDPDGSIEKYRWSFDEDVFRLVDGSTRSDRTIRGYFKVENAPTDEDGGVTQHDIGLTVTDNGGSSSSATTTFTVDPLVIHTTPEHLGDNGNFTMDGTLIISNTDGLYHLEADEGPITVDDTVIQINIAYEGSQTSWVAGPRMIEDGFLREHQTYGRFSDFRIRTVGGGTQSYVLMESNTKYDIRDDSGISGRLNTHIYHPRNLAIRTNLRIRSGSFEVGTLFSKEFIVKGEAAGYHFLDTEDSALHVYNVSEVFDMGRFGNEEFGETTITWSVVGVMPQKVKEEWVPGLAVSVELTNGDENFKPEITYIVGDGVPYPLKVTAELNTQSENGTTISSEYQKVLTGYGVGSGDLPTERSDFSTQVSAEYQRYNATTWSSRSGTQHNAPTVDDDDEYFGGPTKHHGFFEDNGNSEGYQDDGSNGAIARATAQDPQFADYLAGHPDAYCVWTMYNETHRKRWNMTFGEEGSEDYYNVEVTAGAGGGVTDNSLRAFKGRRLDMGPADINGMIAYASGIDRIYRYGEDYEPLVNQSLFASDGEMLFENASAGAAIEVPYMPTVVLQRNATYSYYAVDQAREVSAMVDAGNGQLMYFVHDEGDIDLLWILQGLSG